MSYLFKFITRRDLVRQLIVLGCFSLAVSGCGRAGPTLAGGKPVSYWVHGLSDPDFKVRKQSVTKLAHVGLADPAALPALIDALKDVDARVRREAVLALLQLGRDASSAVPALTEAQQKDRDPWVRSYASKALEKIQAGK